MEKIIDTIFYKCYFKEKSTAMANLKNITLFHFIPFDKRIDGVYVPLNNRSNPIVECFLGNSFVEKSLRILNENSVGYVLLGKYVPNPNYSEDFLIQIINNELAMRHKLALIVFDGNFHKDLLDAIPLMMSLYPEVKFSIRKKHIKDCRCSFSLEKQQGFNRIDLIRTLGLWEDLSLT